MQECLYIDTQVDCTSERDWKGWAKVSDWGVGVDVGESRMDGGVVGWEMGMVVWG